MTSNKLGTVGIVRPTTRIGGYDDLLRMLPEGVSVIPLHLGIRRGTLDELKTALEQYEDKVAELAGQGCDVINPSGAPPFMVLGYDGERKLIADWQQKYKVPIFTSGSSNVDALRALKVKRFVGASYFRGGINKTYAKYFVDAEFEVLDMSGIDVDFEKVSELKSQQVYDFVKGAFLANPTAERSTCSDPPGARSTSSRRWRTTSACRCCTRSLCGAGTSSGIFKSVNR